MAVVADLTAGVVVGGILLHVFYLLNRTWRELRGHGRRYAAPVDVIAQWRQGLFEGDIQSVAYIRALRDHYEAGRKGPQTVAYGFLVERLTPDQREDFDRTGGFWVLGSKGKTRYRISYRRVLNVGTEHAMCCATIGDSYPECDNLLAQKTMIELDEAAFLRCANVYSKQWWI